MNKNANTSSLINRFQTIYILIAGFGMLILIGVSLYIGYKTNKTYVPLIEASKEIKLSITESHLWFEELLIGDTNESIENVWGLFDKAEWYINAMLEGGENKNYVFIPIKEEQVIKEIKLLKIKIKRLREIALQRYNSTKFSKAGSELDIYYDENYKIFKAQSDIVEESIVQLRETGFKQFLVIQIFIIGIAIILFVLISMIIYRFEKTIASYLAKLNAFNTSLEKLVEERTLSLKAANKELEKQSTKLELAYQEISQKELNYRFLAENAHDVVLAYNSKLQRTYVSPSIEKLTGYTVEESMKESVFEMAHPDDLPLLLEAYNKAKEQKLSQEVIRYRRNTKTKGYIWVEIAISTVYNGGKLKNVIINSRDISNQVKYEEELKLAQSKLINSDKMASLGVLTAGIAHEINNPINFVYAGINALEINLKDVTNVLSVYEQINEQNVAQKLDEIQKLKSDLHFEKLMNLVDRSTGNIKKGAERTSEIIKGLKSFSRADTDNLYLMNVNESLDNTLLLLHNQYINRIKIVKKYNTIPDVKCYPGKINQVFVNIVSNAIHAIEKDGTITVCTQLIDKKGVNHIEISISDTGKGMSKEVQDKIFEPFFTLKEVGEGTGLGLSISHGIIEDHKGCIEVESEEGNGATFKIYLPLV